MLFRSLRCGADKGGLSSPDLRRLSIRRGHQFVAARMCVELAAALALDCSAASCGRRIPWGREAATETVGAAAGLAGGEGRGRGADADDEQGHSGDFDRQSRPKSHGTSPH